MMTEEVRNKLIDVIIETVLGGNIASFPVAMGTARKSGVDVYSDSTQRFPIVRAQPPRKLIIGRERY